MHEAYVTIDVDWAPDWAIRRLLEALLESGLRSTWFITHDSAALEDLRAYPDMVELGIHPNFLPGSSHGESAAEVIANCMHIVPEAQTMRTHCLVQSTPILQTVVDESAIRLDASVYLRDLTGVAASSLPLDHGRSLMRVPYVWEDDLEFFAPDSRWNAFDFLQSRHAADEVSIMDIHPIHYVLNSADVRPYQALKSSVGDTRSVTEAQAQRFAFDGAGTMSFVRSLSRARDELEIDLGRPLVSLA